MLLLSKYFLQICISHLLVGIQLSSAVSFGPKESRGQLTDPRIYAASGLAISRVHKNIAYTHNDKDGIQQVFAFDINSGSTVATLLINNATNRDWEDLAYGPCYDDCNTNACSAQTTPSRYCIYIADVGVDVARGAKNVIYAIREPLTLQDASVDLVGVLAFKRVDCGRFKRSVFVRPDVSGRGGSPPENPFERLLLGTVHARGGLWRAPAGFGVKETRRLACVGVGAAREGTKSFKFGGPLTPFPNVIFHWTEVNAETLMLSPGGQLFIMSKVFGGRALFAEIPASGWNKNSTTWLDMNNAAVFKITTSSNDPLGGDISPNGKNLIVVGDEGIYYLSVPDNDYIKSVKNSVPLEVGTYQRVKNSQGIAWSPDEKGFYVIAEGKNSTLYFYSFDEFGVVIG